MIKEIPLEEYIALWEDMKTKMRFNCPGIPPVLMDMTVIGLSGPGTKFKNEYDRQMHEHFNPPMPRSITMVGMDGEELITPIRIKK